MCFSEFLSSPPNFFKYIHIFGGGWGRWGPNTVGGPLGGLKGAKNLSFGTNCRCSTRFDPKIGGVRGLPARHRQGVDAIKICTR